MQNPATLAPDSWKLRATAAPTPRLAPVMNATLSFTRRELTPRRPELLV